MDDSRISTMEKTLLTSMMLGTSLLPMVWITTGFPSASSYPFHPLAFALGIVVMVLGHWFFYRSHADLGLNWSPSLQLREGHQLVDTGVYARIRHPMYAASLVLGLAQLLVVPNWIVGPGWLVSVGLLYLLRIGPEEEMMHDRFGSDYEAYSQRTGRLLPRLRGRRS